MVLAEKSRAKLLRLCTLLALLGFGLLASAEAPGAQPKALTKRCEAADTSCGWTQLITDSSFGQLPTPRDMSVDSAGNIYLAGETYPESGAYGQSSTLIAKFGADGTLKWQRRLVAPGGGFNMAYTIDAGKANSVCVGGVTDGAFSAGKARRGGGFVAHYDLTGAQQWAANIANPIIRLGLDGDGNCYAASLTEVTKFRKDGRRLWSYRMSIGAMAVGLDGTIYLFEQAGDNHDSAWVVLNAAGKLIRQSRLELGKTLAWRRTNFQNAVLVMTDDGALYLQATVADMQPANSGHVDAYLARVTPEGEASWERHYATEGFRWDSFDVAVDRLGNAFLAGRVMALKAPGPTDIFVISYTPAGKLRYAKTFGTDGFDGASRIGLDSAGNYYITGGTEGDLDGEPNPIHNTLAPFIARNRPK